MELYTCSNCGKHGRIVKDLCGSCYMRQYRQDNKEHINEYKRQYRQKNYKQATESERLYKLNNHEHITEYQLDYRRNKGILSVSKNKTCSAYLGIHVAERVLSNVFKDVKRQPNNNHGFDFICNKGKKIDVKSSCLYYNPKYSPRWHFAIRKNKIADFFLCLAFDNRDNLTPLHLWLFPAADVNQFGSISSSIERIYKWDKYTLDIGKVITCCDSLTTAGETICHTG